ncbi:MAG: acyl-CoA dehydrogenase, partial [Deltaproteobacteria bacterium]|nr:acyl-CoA dehydrogenase [Deltaproteobacteria bacterium]
MNLAIDSATLKRLVGIRAMGESQIRPVGLEADRLGRPTPPDHDFFQLLLKVGLGRSRWAGEEVSSSKPEPGAQASSPSVGNSRGMLCIAEEMSYWDRGVAVSFPGPGLGEPPLLSMGTEDQ